MMTVDTPRVRAGVAEVPPAGVPARAGVWGVVRAMAWKESREIGILTGVLGVAYGALLATILRETQAIVASDSSNLQAGAALQPAFMKSALVAGPMAALLIGLMQFFRESRPDRYGLLTHRAASRSMIFWSKSGVGVGMYVAALGLPLLVALWWASDPENIPLPFSWRMGLAPLADILSGVPYYFAGVLVTQRTDARWEASRLLPIAGPVIGTLVDGISPTFGWAVLAIGVMSVVMGIAARGYFVAAGQYGAMARHAKGVMGFVLLAAILTLGTAGFELLSALMPYRRTTALYQYLAYYKDGTPILVEDHYSMGPTIVRDVNGKKLEELDSSRRYGPDNPIIFAAGRSGLYYQHQRQSFHDGQRYFEKAGRTKLHESWFRSNELTGGDYLVGFDERARRLVGAIGVHGLELGVAVPAARFAWPMGIMDDQSREDTPADKQVPGSLISAGDTLYRMNERQEVKAVFTTAGHEMIFAMEALKLGDDAPQRVVLQREKGATLLSEEGAMRVLYEYPTDRNQWDRVDIGGDRETGKFFLEFRKQFANDASAHIVFFTAAGVMDHAVDVHWKPMLGMLPEPVDVGRAYIYPMMAPPVVLGWPAIFDLMLHLQVPEYPHVIMPRSAASIGVGVLIGIATFLMARRSGVGRAAWMWGVMGLLLGLAGLLLMLCLRGLPVVVTCAGCGKGRRVDQGKCPHCGAGISGPAANGTEIFG